jgi:predicted membrane channel-forming protein YqfA (hemolysin III family)
MEKYATFRLLFYIMTLTICLGLAVTARFYFATPIEIQEFYSDLIMSFVYLGIGFWFYQSKFPEKCMKKAKKEKLVKKAERKCVELFCPSHFWWHLFVVLNGYTLYWLSYRVNLHVEYYYDKNEPGITKQN